MVVRIADSQYMVENKFNKQQYFYDKDLGYVWLTKTKDSWKIVYSTVASSILRWKWNCYIKDQEIVIKRKITVYQILLLVLGVIPAALFELLVVIGTLMFIITNSYTAFLFGGTMLFTAMAIGVCLLYYSCFYKNADRVIVQILEKTIGEPVTVVM